VLDTCVIVAALRSRFGVSNALLEDALRGRLQILATAPLFLEYEEVLLRPEQRLAHKLEPSQIEVFLEELAAWVEPVELHFRSRPQVSDPDDELVFETAINGRADALVTHNVRDFIPAAGQFGLAVLRPQELQRRLNS
jgi:putative PIN family toxin of toxin-antitoxin system